VKEVCLLIAACCLLLSGCSGRSPPPPIWLAHVATLSGPDRQAGESAARGIRLAVEEINKNLDQPADRPLKVIHSDARGKLEAFEAEAVRLVAINRVSFLLGGTTPEEVERLDRARVPTVTPTGVRTRTMSDAVFFTGLTPRQRAWVLAQFAALELNASAVAVLEDDRREEALEVSEAFARELAQALTKKDAKLAASVRKLRFGKDAKASDLIQPLLEQIARDQLKAVVFAGQPADLRELGPLPLPVLLACEEVSAKVLQARRPANKEMFFVTTFVTDGDTAKAQEFAKRFKQAFNEDAGVQAALAYEGLKLLAEAINRSKDALTPARVRDELTKLKDFGGLTGPLSFTPERQLRRPAFVVRVEETGVKTVKRYNVDP
jgi:branched-chain amino acid transport system substrate-binding protein